MGAIDTASGSQRRAALGRIGASGAMMGVNVETRATPKRCGHIQMLIQTSLTFPLNHLIYKPESDLARLITNQVLYQLS